MIPLDYGALAHQTIEFLKSCMTAAGGKIAAETVWNFLKGKFTKPAASGALEEVEQAPQNNTKWEVLKLQIKSALEEDDNFRKELEALLPKGVVEKAVTQTANNIGDNNITSQLSGSGSIQVNRPSEPPIKNS
jgi:hypothetical protein